MSDTDLQLLIASRLEDMADQVEQLFVAGNIEDARLLREEGLHLARCFDDGYTFMYLPDFTESLS